MSKSDAGYERLSQQMQNLELQAEQQITLYKEQQGRLAQRDQESAPHSDSEDEESADQIAAANEVKKQIRLLEDTQVSHGVVFAQVRAARTHQELGKVTSDKDSMAFSGMPASLVGKIDQKVGDVSATNGSKSFGGMFEGDMNMFFSRAK